MEEHEDRPDKFYNTFKPFISNKGKGSSAIHLKTKENNNRKNQSEVAETLARYFTNAALNIGGDHVSRLTEEDHSENDSVKSIQEAYEENCFDLKLLTPNEVQYGHLKTSILRNLVAGILRSHRSFLRMRLMEQQYG